MRDEFPLVSEILHLNHAGVGPWPRRTVEAVTRFAAENAHRGSLRYPDWLAAEQRLRERLARLINAAPSDIALVKSTSEALSIIAHGLHWRPGDNIVGITQEFPSNRIVWESLASQGVTLRQLDIDRSAQPEDDLLTLCDENTRLVAVSSVQYARGLRLDLARLGTSCRARGIRLCIDAIQSLGAFPFDLRVVGADFVVADGHKWMLGPEGLALLYVSPALREELELRQFGWHMVAERGQFERRDWRPAPDATRFECGSPNMLGVHALEASLSLLDEVGIDQVAAAIGERVARLIELTDRHGFELLSPRSAPLRAGIVTFRVPDRDQQALYQALMGSGVLCAQRGAGIRFSPHFHTSEETIEQAMTLTAALAHQL
ncbi:selenocysteine lyase [Thioflavicoccus mobilis 8321]|uniref:Selenocysteine lyase n=1 Tax=Thioflavicoccus mobilis 8321 TaxID=765912 RepID=L0GXH9_9GAMM|nr:aminotransferase class V-fold PLP-dependent enzyme [Thioflavicoccus mobilis]AGA90701.1 selenocysteine lyase [Thioflavicoccus mobilis 8321]